MADRERSFKQTLQDITASIPLPSKIRAKLLNVSIKTTHLTVSNKVTNEIILDGDLHAAVDESESTWWIEDEQELFVNLEKKNKQEWWPRVLTCDPTIDTTKIEPEQSQLSDLDSETRASVEKMMFDQRQKQLGLPTSDQLQKQKTFENFKKMHPELDFSKVKPEF